MVEKLTETNLELEERMSMMAVPDGPTYPRGVAADHVAPRTHTLAATRRKRNDFWKSRERCAMPQYPLCDDTPLSPLPPAVSKPR